MSNCSDTAINFEFLQMGFCDEQMLSSLSKLYQDVMLIKIDDGSHHLIQNDEDFPLQ